MTENRIPDYLDHIRGIAEEPPKVTNLRLFCPERLLYVLF